MNRADRRAAARLARGGIVSVMLGGPDQECELCRSLGLVAPERTAARPSTAAAGLTTALPPTVEDIDQPEE